MALTPDPAAQAQLTSSVLGVHWLIEADFAVGTQRITTAPVNVVSGGYTYIGLGQLITVSDISESDDISAAKITLGLSITDQAQIAATIGDASTYRGKSIRFYIQLFNENFVPVGEKILRWTGHMNPVSVKPQTSEDGSTSGRIELPCTRAGMNKFRNFEGLRLTHEQQILRYPGDLGLQYMKDLIEKPSVWLTKEFQKQ